MMKYLDKVTNVIKSAVFSYNCSSCSEPVFRSETMCHSCWNKIIFISAKACKTCGLPLHCSHSSQIYCSDFCATRRWFIEEVRAAAIYSESVAKLIHQFKYQDKTQHLKILTNLLLYAFIYIKTDIDLVIPVPIHQIRMKKRGYNQAALLAKNFSNAIGKEWSSDILAKNINTNQQLDLSRKMRMHNVKNSFIVRSQYKDSIRGKNILIIDDVVTTGATINECAKIMKKAKANKVLALCIART